MTGPDRVPARPEDHHAAPGRMAGERAEAETSHPYDLPEPEDLRTSGRPAYLIVIDQLRDWPNARSPSLAELFETRPARTHEPEPDLEAEP